jgi:hypothetical protein
MRFQETHVGALDARALRAALAASTQALMKEGSDANLPNAGLVADRLTEIG